MVDVNNRGKLWLQVYRDKHSDRGQTVIMEFHEQSIGKQLTEAIVGELPTKFPVAFVREKNVYWVNGTV